MDSLDVAGMEGLPDSFQVGVPGPYYVTTRNSAGESCASNIATVAGPTTGVDQHPGSYDQVIRSVLFNVQGRVVRGKPATGVYWQRTYFKSGRIKTGKVVVLK